MNYIKRTILGIVKKVIDKRKTNSNNFNLDNLLFPSSCRGANQINNNNNENENSNVNQNLLSVLNPNTLNVLPDLISPKINVTSFF